MRHASYAVRIVCRRLSTFTLPRSPAAGSVRPRPLNHRGEQLPNAMVQLTGRQQAEMPAEAADRIATVIFSSPHLNAIMWFIPTCQFMFHPILDLAMVQQAGGQADRRGPPRAGRPRRQQARMPLVSHYVVHSVLNHLILLGE